MSGKEITQKLGDRLLDARQEALKNHHSSGIRPHGKLWGMDVFSWIHPDLHVLSNTVHAFPFPVIWFGGTHEITCTLEEDPSLLSNISSIVLYESNLFTLPDELINTVRNCVGAGSVEEAFQMLRIVKSPPSVLLFTASGNEAEDLKMEFESVLKVLQLG